MARRITFFQGVHTTAEHENGAPRVISASRGTPLSVVPVTPGLLTLAPDGLTITAANPAVILDMHPPPFGFGVRARGQVPFSPTPEACSS